jgi:hypothetical protein
MMITLQHCHSLDDGAELEANGQHGKFDFSSLILAISIERD